MRAFVVGVLVAVLPVAALAQPDPQAPAPQADAPPDDGAGAPAMTPDPTPDPTPPVDPVAPPLDPAPPTEPSPDVSPADRPPPAGWRLMLSDLTVLRLNPIGLETRARFGLQKQLYASDKAITRNNFAFVGAYPKLNPAFANLGIGGELQPASIFNVRAFAELQQYFGTFGFLQSFSSANAIYSDHALKELRDNPVLAPQSTQAFHASIQPLLQLKVGPIAVRGLFQLDYWDFKIRAGDTTAYEATFDTLVPDKGWTLAVDTDVLYTGKQNLAIGLRHSLVRPFYSSRHFGDSSDEAAYDDNGHQRVGLFAAYTLKDHGPSRYNKPTIVLIVSWYLSHRWRLGEPSTLPIGGSTDNYTSRAFPYFLIGYAFESDFLAVK